MTKGPPGRRAARDRPSALVLLQTETDRQTESETQAETDRQTAGVSEDARGGQQQQQLAVIVGSEPQRSARR